MPISDSPNFAEGDPFPCCSRGEHNAAPADDVREALIKELRLWAKLIGTEPRGARDLFNRAAEAIAEIHPRGTVTDAEVDRVQEAAGERSVFVQDWQVRVILEEARRA